MNKEAFIKEVYDSAFKNELEKTSGPVKSILGRIWSPGGNTSDAAKGLGKKILSKRQAVRKKYNVGSLEDQASKAKGAYSKLKSTAANQTSRIDRLGQAGTFERMLGGRLGTRRRRLTQLRSTRGERFATQKSLPGALKAQRSAVAKRTLGRQAAKKELSGVEKQFHREATGIRARQYANVAARTGVIGAGAYGGTKAYDSFSNRNNRYY